jgi:hypothetical protein
MVDDGDVDVYLSKSPNPFRDKMPPEIPAAFYGYWRPSLMVRHKGAPAADSLFVAVIEPFAAAPAIAGIERLPLAAGDLDHVALRVRFQDGREDALLVDLANPVVTGQPSPGRFATADGKLALLGRVAVLSRRGAASESAVLVAGTRFDHDGRGLSAERASYAGSITGVQRTAESCGPNAFLTDAALPEGTTLRGRWIQVTFGSYKVVPDGSGAFPAGVQEETGIRQPYRIDHVEKAQGQTRVVLTDDPMLTASKGQLIETTRPGRTFEGPATFEITLSAGP